MLHQLPVAMLRNNCPPRQQPNSLSLLILQVWIRSLKGIRKFVFFLEACGRGWELITKLWGPAALGPGVCIAPTSDAVLTARSTQILQPPYKDLPYRELSLYQPCSPLVTPHHCC